LNIVWGWKAEREARKVGETRVETDAGLSILHRKKRGRRSSASVAYNGRLTQRWGPADSVKGRLGKKEAPAIEGRVGKTTREELAND